MRSRGHRICAEEIARRVWGEEKAGSELIWVHISSLRGKLDKIGAKAKICTYRGPGVRAGGLKPSRARRKDRRAASAGRERRKYPIQPKNAPTVQKAAGALLLELKKNHLFRDDFQPGD